MSDVKTRLIEAADYLDRLADEAEYRDGRWFVDVAVLANSIKWLGPTHDALTATVPQAELVNAFSPAVVHVLAQWLRTEAKLNAGDELHDKDCTVESCTAVAALALADRLLKGKGEQS